MAIDTEKIDEAVLALLYLTRCEDPIGAASWKDHDWDALSRLHEKGFIGNPVGKKKSVALTTEGKTRSEELFRKLFENPSDCGCFESSRFDRFRRFQELSCASLSIVRSACVFSFSLSAWFRHPPSERRAK